MEDSGSREPSGPRSVARTWARGPECARQHEVVLPWFHEAFTVAAVDASSQRETLMVSGQGGRHIERMITVMTKRLLVVGGVLAALAVPAGVAVAATTAPSPSPKAPATTQPYGPGSGRMMVGTGDPQDCPYYN